MIEPIFLQGVCKDYIWGGNRLRQEFGKISDADIIAESWELACHKDGSSIIISNKDKGLNITEYIAKYGTGFLGTNCKDIKTLPILIKLIDAKENLSIQVHPDDEYSMKVEGEPGKTEMWYIIDAEMGATIYYGVKRCVSKDEFLKRIENQTLTEVLNRVEVTPGQLIFIPSGTLHAIGAGILLAEIQQNSNITYRVYDYGRIGRDGKLRELNINKAMEIANLTPMKPTVQYESRIIGDATVRKLEHCKYFSSDLMYVSTKVFLCVDSKSLQHLLILEGKGILTVAGIDYSFHKGNSILLPANLGKYSVTGKCRLILTYMD